MSSPRPTLEALSVSSMRASALGRAGALLAPRARQPPWEGLEGLAGQGQNWASLLRRLPCQEQEQHRLESPGLDGLCCGPFGFGGALGRFGR